MINRGESLGKYEKYGICREISCGLKVQLELRGREELEGHAVVGCGAILADGFAVGWGGIAFVAVPVVLGIVLMDAEHIVVTVGLGKDAGGSNAHVGSIALDDGGVGDVLVGHEAVAVDEEVLGAYFQLSNGTVHGEDGGTEDVNLVDFLVGDHAHGPGKGFALDDFAEGVAMFLRELLGVVEHRKRHTPPPFVHPLYLRGGIKWKDDGGGIDGAGKAATAGLVTAGFDDVWM